MVVSRVNSDDEECELSCKSNLNTLMDVERGVPVNHQNEEINISNGSRSLPDTSSNAHEIIVRETLNAVGRTAFGICAIEVWVYNSQIKALERYRVGWWRDPVFDASSNMKRLEDESRTDYLEATSLPAGVGVAGNLWSELYGTSCMTSWRDLLQMSQDPDQPYNERLNVLAEVFGLAAAGNFTFRYLEEEIEGTVVFYARRSVDLNKISDEQNMNYLLSSVQLICSTLSWEKLLKDAMRERQTDLQEAYKRVRASLMAVSFFRSSLTQSQRLQLKKIGKCEIFVNQSTAFLKKKFFQVASKVKGSGQIPPPPMSHGMCIFIFFGCLISLFILSWTNKGIKHASNEDLKILMSPLAALVTSHYGFTAAPASQPRNSIFGLLIAASIGNASTHIPDDVLPMWVRIALVPAIAITLTVGMGYGHPPAGAIALLFATRPESSWDDLAMLLVGYSIAIIVAIIYISLFEARAFPMYWYFPNPLEWIGLFRGKQKT